MSRSLASSPRRPSLIAAFASDRGLWLGAILVALTAAAVMIVRRAGQLDSVLGDPDDALRLSMVRDLLHGQDWRHPQVLRLNPPEGVFMHWSRLVDGGLALTERIFELALPPARAEWMMRLTWPLLWIAPCAAAMILAVRNLASVRAAAGAATAAAVLVLIANVPWAFGQFTPGRIDHHNVQIALCLVALAAASAGPSNLRAALVAGAATGLGLAIGFEAVVFEAVAAAYVAFRFVRDPGHWRFTAVYALALAAFASAAFLIQTPPARWSSVQCDALGWNMLASVLAGALTLAAAAALTRGRSWPVRLAGAAAAGLFALALFLSFDASCAYGPMADVDPRVRPFWFNDIDELRSFRTLLFADPQVLAGLAFPQLMGLGATGVLIWSRRRERPVDPVLVYWGVLQLLALALSASAERMAFYGLWLCTAPIAALVTEILIWRRREDWVALATIAMLLAPLIPTFFLVEAVGAMAPRGTATGVTDATDDRCALPASFATLARQPPGLVVGEIDLGPYVLATTRSSALAAPYHRMTGAILADEQILAAPPPLAETRARRAGATYVMECRAHSRNILRLSLAADSLQKQLDAGRIPAWLEPLSRPDDPVLFYRIRSAAGPSAAPGRRPS
jgi:hypothetical protein